MPLPTRTQVQNTFYSVTAESRRKDLIDGFFKSAPLIARLYKKNSIKVKGGTEIRVSHIYAGFPAQSYGRGPNSTPPAVNSPPRWSSTGSTCMHRSTSTSSTSN